ADRCAQPARLARGRGRARGPARGGAPLLRRRPPPRARRAAGAGAAGSVGSARRGDRALRSLPAAPLRRLRRPAPPGSAGGLRPAPAAHSRARHARRRDARHGGAARPAAGRRVIDAYVAIGSNLGDRDAHLALALRRLAALPDTERVAVSPVYETDPVGPP